MFLCNTLGNPDDISIFLFFQFQMRVEDTEMKLSKKGIHVQFHLNERNKQL